jgi:ketosteroid isomerase-like protein
MDDRRREMVEDLFDAFNRRDVEAIVALCHEDMEFFAVTAEEVGRTDPYVGPDGLRAYLADVSAVWEELLISPEQVEQREDALLVQGRVYLRSRDLGIRDMPVGWIWEIRDDRFERGRVFADPEEAIRRFSRADRPERRPDPGASRSTIRLR